MTRDVTWQLVAVANLATAGAYFAISGLVFGGLVKTGQLRTNRLGAATGTIFLTCAVHHGAHSVHMLLPLIGADKAHGLAMRAAWDWHTVVWDMFTAAVGVYYLTLRGSYVRLLDGVQLFEDIEARHAQALELNDDILQGLAVAGAALELGDVKRSRDAIEQTQQRAKSIVAGLLGSGGVQRVRPGELRRSERARIGSGG